MASTFYSSWHVSLGSYSKRRFCRGIVACSALRANTHGRINYTRSLPRYRIDIAISSMYIVHSRICTHSSSGYMGMLIRAKFRNMNIVSIELRLNLRNTCPDSLRISANPHPAYKTWAVPGFHIETSLDTYLPGLTIHTSHLQRRLWMASSCPETFFA